MLNLPLEQSAQRRSLQAGKYGFFHGVYSFEMGLGNEANISVRRLKPRMPHQLSEQKGIQIVLPALNRPEPMPQCVGGLFLDARPSAPAFETVPKCACRVRVSAPVEENERRFGMRCRLPKYDFFRRLAEG